MTTTKGKTRVFVYGTLKLNQSAQNMITNDKESMFISCDYIKGKYTLHDLGGFPALVDGDDENIICGQLFVVSDEVLAALDFYEGHPTFYQRRKIETGVHGERAWVYFMVNKETVHGTPVVDGIWNPSVLERGFWEQKEGEADDTAVG